MPPPPSKHSTPRVKSRSGGDDLWSFIRMLLVCGVLAGLVYAGWTAPLHRLGETWFGLAPLPPKAPIYARLATRPVKKLAVPQNITIPGLGKARATPPKSMAPAKRSDGSP